MKLLSIIAFMSLALSSCSGNKVKETGSSSDDTFYSIKCEASYGDKPILVITYTRSTISHAKIKTYDVAQKLRSVGLLHFDSVRCDII